MLDSLPVFEKARPELQPFHPSICGEYCNLHLLSFLISFLIAGITPDGIVGHSVGELGCAYADGSFTAEEVILAAYWRGELIKQSL